MWPDIHIPVNRKALSELLPGVSGEVQGEKMMTTYIHYGSDHFSPQLFIPVRNGDWRPKPVDGTGLWASRVDDECASSVHDRQRE